MTKKLLLQPRHYLLYSVNKSAINKILSMKMFISWFWNALLRRGSELMAQIHLFINLFCKFQFETPLKYKENVELMKYGMAVFKNCITTIADSVLPKHRSGYLVHAKVEFRTTDRKTSGKGSLQLTFQSSFLKQHHVDIIGRILSSYDEPILILNTLSFAEKLLAVRWVFERIVFARWFATGTTGHPYEIPTKQSEFHWKGCICYLDSCLFNKQLAYWIDGLSCTRENLRWESIREK